MIGPSQPLRIVCISDTHNYQGLFEVPDGDVLVHAGDCTMRGEEDEIRAVGTWLRGLPHPHKILVPGNHDFLFEQEPEKAFALVEGDGVSVLLDNGVELFGLRFWGSPWQPWFHDWAFNLERGSELRERWNGIPGGTDVLITHGPPHGTMDVVDRGGHRVGCEELALRLEELSVDLHIFGHIHEGYGVQEHASGGMSVNASICTRMYAPMQKPIVLEWNPGHAPTVISP